MKVFRSLLQGLAGSGQGGVNDKNIPLSIDHNLNSFHIDDEEEKDDVAISVTQSFARRLLATAYDVTAEVEPDDKYSQESFEKRLRALQDSLIKSLPELEPDTLETFVASCQAFNDAAESKKEADATLAKIRKNSEDRKKKNGGKDDKDDDDAIKTAQSAVNAAQKTLQATQDITMSSAKPLLNQFHSWAQSPAMNMPDLLEATVLTQGTPKGLAEFCSQDPKTLGPLIDELFTQDHQACLIDMVRSNGPSGGYWGAMKKIFVSLLSQFPDNHPTKPLYRRIALAVALEHANPVQFFKEDGKFVDPVGRFWHYVNAYERGELDKDFETLDIWELRLVVDCNARDDQIQWGRDYLRAYRPDQILMADRKWRYCRAVRTDVFYCNPHVDYKSYQEIISVGGECGPRAWFGRFICKSFGHPTWGVRQPGHAAMGKYTGDPKLGWVIDLGSDWQWSWFEDHRFLAPGQKISQTNRSGLDFVEETWARAAVDPQEYFSLVSLIECVADVLGERVVQQVRPEKVWRSLALMQRKVLAKKAKSDPKLEQELRSEEMEASILESTDVSPTVFGALDSGMVVIDAGSAKNSAKCVVMPSFLSGTQIHLVDGSSFAEYALPEVLKAGSYRIAIRYVNVHAAQVPLTVQIESDEDVTDISDESAVILDIPTIPMNYTVGRWETTEPVEVFIGSGSSTMKIYRDCSSLGGRPCYGLSIKDIAFQPLS